MEKTINHICVCICTYKRPHYLKRLLSEIQSQNTEEYFTFSTVIVDNDIELSAKETVREIQSSATIPFEYFHEPEKNIALARNMAIQNSSGDYIAFIDDDEFPGPDWLLNLYKTIQAEKVDGVLGPVNPNFEIVPPSWLIKSGLCERPSFPSGTILNNPKYTRTGNVLLDKRIFSENRYWFDREFGISGGEDVEFFSRMIKKGYKFIWCDEAYVYESIPAERSKRCYFIRRALLRGTINSRTSSLKGIVKSIIASSIYTTTLPFLLITGQHLFMKYLIKDLDHIGKLLGLIGLNTIREKTF